MPTTETEEEALRAEFKQSLSELETAITKKVVREVLQKTARGPGAGFSSSAAVVEPGHQRTVLLADESKVRDFLSQPKSFRSSLAFEGRIERKAIVSGISPTMYAPGVHGQQLPGLRLDELLPHISVSAGGAVSWTQETGFVPGADVVPETTLKPSTTLSFTNITTPFSVIANVLKISVQALTDTPQLQAWINSRLMYAVQLREENYLLNDPVAGMLAAAQALDPAFAPVAPVTALDQVAAAISQLEAAGYLVDGIVMSGSDVNKARLAKSSTGEYLWSQPDSGIGATSLWGTPLVISPSLAAGTFLVGAFGQSTILFDRDVLRLDISFEDEDNFVRNLATIRAELRAALAIPAPAGLIKGSFTGS